MTPRHIAGLPLAMVAALWAGPALARRPGCRYLGVEVGPGVSARFPGLADSVRRAFDGRADIQRCARVQLSARSSSLDLEVALPDGRSATRSVSRREDVVPALEALLVVPERDATAPAPASAPPAPAVQRRPRPSLPAESGPATFRELARHRAASTADLPVADRGASMSASRDRRNGLGIELDVETGARVGDGQTSLGVGALSLVDVSGWLVGFEGRLDRYRQIAGTRDAGALELGVIGGRRIGSGNITADFIGGIAAALQGTSTFEVQTPSGTTRRSSSGAPPRLLLGARMSVAARSTVHPFFGLEGELGPWSNRAKPVSNAFRLPRWTVGLSLGATVGAQ